MDIHVMRARSMEELDLAYQCHHDWFAEAEYIEPNKLGRYTDDFTARSTHFLAFRDTISKANVIGIVRAALKAPFRTLEEFDINDAYRNYDFSETLCMESSALCWRSNWGFAALPHLYRALCQYGLLAGKTRLICNLDNRVIRITQRMGLPIEIIGKSRFYMGSHKTPVMLERTTLLGYVAQNCNQELVRILQMPLL